MDRSELERVIRLGENSKVQFKERLPVIDSLAQEIIAFTNTDGGTLIIGVNDKTGDLNGLTFTEIQAANQQIVNAASQSVFPPVFLKTESVSLNDQTLLIVEIPEGISKPYKDRNGTIFLKNGANKRKVTSNEEISRLLQTSKVMFADEMLVKGSQSADVDKSLFNEFIKVKCNRSLDDLGVSQETAMANLNLLKENELTLTGLLLFSEKRQYFKPLFTIQFVSAGDNLNNGNTYTDSEPPIDGPLKTIFGKAMGFIDRKMRKVPTGESFNSQATWEIPYAVFEELIVNALIHRDYFIQSTIKIFVYPGRVEIHSPGRLPNALTIENVKNGISIQRNPIYNP